MLITAIHLTALGQIEGGSDDIARRGKDGEITRYQVLPAELHRNGIGTADVEDVHGATIAVQLIWQRKVNAFMAQQRRAPTNAELYLLWHRPATVLMPVTRKPTRKESERAERFANLVRSLEKTHSPADVRRSTQIFKK